MQGKSEAEIFWLMERRNRRWRIGELTIDNVEGAWLYDQMGYPMPHEEVVEAVDYITKILELDPKIIEYHLMVNQKKEEEYRIRMNRVPHVFNHPGYVYLIYDPKTGWHKIGSTVDVSRRLKELKRSFENDDLTFIHSWKTINCRKDELKLHKIFKHLRKKQEWFDLGNHYIDWLKHNSLEKIIKYKDINGVTSGETHGI